MSAILSQLQWRYATKEFDTEKKLSSEQEHTIIEALRLAPSSFGLQPWKFVIVTDPVIRAKLREQAWGQAQITDASHLVVLCSLKNLDQTHVDKYVDLTAKERNIPREKLDGFHKMIMGSINSKDAEAVKTWSKEQVYIALGVLLTTCALEQIDACPMGGFNNAGFDEILGLSEYNIESAVICPVGFRKESDATSKLAKVRFPESEVIIKK